MFRAKGRGRNLLLPDKKEKDSGQERSCNMSENSTSRKMLSLVLLIAGAVGLVAALVMDFSGSENSIRVRF